MTFRNLTLLVITALPTCQPAPAHADTFPPGFEPTEAPAPIEKLAPGDPLGYRPAVLPRIPGGVSYYRVFDPPMRLAPAAVAAPWNGAPRGFVVPTTALSRWNGTPAPPPGLPPGWDRPVTPTPKPLAPDDGDAVPGPLPLLGIGAMIHVSRKLRRRIGR
jgi:hypothetical protein